MYKISVTQFWKQKAHSSKYQRCIWLTVAYYVEPYEADIFIGLKNSQISAISYGLNSHLSFNHQPKNMNQSECTQTVCCCISIQAPSGGRKQNCRLYLFIPPLLLFLNCFTFFPICFLKGHYTSEEHLDWQFEQA